MGTSAYANDIGWVKFDFVNNTDEDFLAYTGSEKGYKWDTTSCGDKGAPREIPAHTTARRVVCTVILEDYSVLQGGNLYIKSVKKGVINSYHYSIIWKFLGKVFEWLDFNKPSEEHTDIFKVNFPKPMPYDSPCDSSQGKCQTYQTVVIDPK